MSTLITTVCDDVRSIEIRIRWIPTAVLYAVYAAMHTTGMLDVSTMSVAESVYTGACGVLVAVLLRYHKRIMQYGEPKN